MNLGSLYITITTNSYHLIYTEHDGSRDNYSYLYSGDVRFSFLLIHVSRDFRLRGYYSV
jgi:hypothetical protein